MDGCGYQGRMMLQRSLASLALAASLAVMVIPSAPALADGAASTRNIIGGAAVAAGTLLIINHNKQVHAREDAMSQQRAAAEESANNAQAAYAAEKASYNHQVAINNELKHEVAVQHSMIVSMRSRMNKQTAVLKAAQPAAAGAPARVAMTTYGWGAQ